MGKKKSKDNEAKLIQLRKKLAQNEKEREKILTKLLKLEEMDDAAAGESVASKVESS